MSLEEMLIAHQVMAWLTPDELEELADLLEHAPLPVHWCCRVPLRELHRRVVREFGEGCPAARQLESLIL